MVKQEKRPPQRRNKSATEQAILEGLHEGESSSLRYSVIPCCLKSALTSFEQKNKFLHLFDEQARVQGVFRKVVGLYVNWTVMKALTNREEPPPINKTLFDQAWSLLDSKRVPTRRSQWTQDMKAHLDLFIQESGLNIKDLPMPVLYELRQPTTRDMETVSINHITVNLESRISAYILFRIANLPSARYLKMKHIRSVARRILNSIMNGVTHLDSSFKLEHTPELQLVELQDVLTGVNAMIHHLLFENGRRRSDSKLRKDAHRFLPFLFHVSSEFERVNENRRQLRDELRHRVTKNERRKLLLPKWREEGLLLPGKPFAILPDWQLQPVFVEYATTQLASMFGTKLGQMDIFEKKVFDLSRISPLKRHNWHMIKFKTNGVELHVFLGALKSRHPPAYNTQCLKDAGYNLKKPPKEGVDVMTTKRGVYRILQHRYDNKAVDPDQSNKIKIHLVDPGVVKVVSVREIMLSDATTPADIIKRSKTWCVREEDYKRDTGWASIRKRETMRRCGKRVYQDAVTNLRHTRKRTVALDVFLNYIRTYFQHLRALSRELSSRCRRVTRYLNMKNIQKTMDRLANRLTGRRKEATDDRIKPVVAFGDGNFRAKRGHVAVPRKALVMKCAHRGLVFVFSERGTSKYCPTYECGGEMKDIPECRRLRRCSSDPNNDTACVLSKYSIDRDESATIAMAIIMRDAMMRNSRPTQFCC